ncbi:MAG: membrane protein insertion efficiency factor YidD [Patescibacteria group bacterium]
MLKRVALWLIRLYQKTFSPDHGWFRARFPYGYCKFYPSCSEYTYQAIDKFGFFKGIFKGFWRIVRCNPWSRGGMDLVK